MLHTRPPPAHCDLLPSTGINPNASSQDAAKKGGMVPALSYNFLKPWTRGGGGTVDQFMNNLVASVCYLVQVSVVSAMIWQLPSRWQPFLGGRVLPSTWPGCGLYRAPIAVRPPWISPCQSSRWEKEREWWKQLIEIGVGGNTLHNLQESWPAETQNRSWDVLSAHSIPRPEPCLPKNHAVVYRYILIPHTDIESPPPVTCESLGARLHV